MDIRDIIRFQLELITHYDAQAAQARDQLRRDGKRIIDYERDHREQFTVRDWETEEELFTGTEDAMATFFHENPNLTHIDHAHGMVDWTLKTLPGLPEELQEVIMAWVETHEAEARELVAHPDPATVSAP